MNAHTIIAATKGKSPQLCTLANVLADNRGWCDGRSAWLSALTYDEQCAALGLAARYPDHVRALVTHDLSSAEIKNIGDLISEIRIGN